MRSAKNTEMTTIIFDTLQYAKEAEAAGFSKSQAEFQAESIAKIIENELATKRDLKDLENRIIIKFGSMLIATIGILSLISRWREIIIFCLYLSLIFNPTNTILMGI